MATIPIFEKKDQRIGAAVSVGFMGLILLVLLLLSYQVADPPPEPYVQPATMDNPLKFENLKVEAGGGAEGSPSDDPVKEQTPQTEKVITKTTNPETSTPTGQSSNTNTNNSQEEPSSSQQSTNPFGTGGSSDDGQSTGKFGKDEGTSAGPSKGAGSGKGRVRLNDPQVDNIVSDANHKIVLRVYFNAEGVVVNVKNLVSQTTTTDQRIINQVIAAVKAQVRFDKDPGARVQYQDVPIYLRAS